MSEYLLTLTIGSFAMWCVSRVYQVWDRFFSFDKPIYFNCSCKTPTGMTGWYIVALMSVVCFVFYGSCVVLWFLEFVFWVSGRFEVYKFMSFVHTVGVFSSFSHSVNLLFNLYMDFSWISPVCLGFVVFLDGFIFAGLLKASAWLHSTPMIFLTLCSLFVLFYLIWWMISCERRFIAAVAIISSLSDQEPLFVVSLFSYCHLGLLLIRCWICQFVVEKFSLCRLYWISCWTWAWHFFKFRRNSLLVSSWNLLFCSSDIETWASVMG